MGKVATIIADSGAGALSQASLSSKAQADSNTSTVHSAVLEPRFDIGAPFSPAAALGSRKQLEELRARYDITSDQLQALAGAGVQEAMPFLPREALHIGFIDHALAAIRPRCQCDIVLSLDGVMYRAEAGHQYGDLSKPYKEQVASRHCENNPDADFRKLNAHVFIDIYNGRDFSNPHDLGEIAAHIRKTVELSHAMGSYSLGYKHLHYLAHSIDWYDAELRIERKRGYTDPAALDVISGGNRPQEFALSAGTHTLIIRGREAGTAIDAVAVMRAMGTAPLSPMNVRVR